MESKSDCNTRILRCRAGMIRIALVSIISLASGQEGGAHRDASSNARCATLSPASTLRGFLSSGVP